jgi:hypothetical protein
MEGFQVVGEEVVSIKHLRLLCALRSFGLRSWRRGERGEVKMKRTVWSRGGRNTRPGMERKGKDEREGKDRRVMISGTK